ncbi:CaiB/BaiF CoA transferase family protein [Burkholderia lata]|uniref:L-carnitine dehydratase n=1 Tax=Burkholderia lata (strain ATCC 17760 / DSM 23089 / LMG 22485 / NCIMB 9086 / R18194 / 383) TaxID=482957 RepID=A0A6P2KNY4_BURL3|nr:CaiB/BaiF CoA-transferase family protein [Burkholderia lata]VWB58480.1 L-carnitine dehydratase [Burkholderia lata]
MHDAARAGGALPPLLSGLRVLDLSRNLPGPFATRMLADLGASVIKVEPPEGDPTRPLAGLFDALNHGKECRTVDFRRDADLDRLRAWTKEADVLLDSFRPGVLQSLGLDRAALHAINPRLTMASITGYGQSGPWACKAGHDINFMAMSGVLDQMRAPTGELAQPNVQWGDLAGGSAMACIAVLSGVFDAQRTGRGRHLDVSMTHGLHAQLVMPRATGAMLAATLGRRPGAGEDLLNGALPCYGLYATRDGRHLAVGALEHKFWKAACDVFDRPDWAARHWQRGQLPGSSDCAALRAEVERLIASQPLAIWSERFASADACVTPVLTLEEAHAHPLFSDHARLQPWAEIGA